MSSSSTGMGQLQNGSVYLYCLMASTRLCVSVIWDGRGEKRVGAACVAVPEAGAAGRGRGDRKVRVMGGSSSACTAAPPKSSFGTSSRLGGLGGETCTWKGWSSSSSVSLEAC